MKDVSQRYTNTPTPTYYTLSLLGRPLLPLSLHTITHTNSLPLSFSIYEHSHTDRSLEHKTPFSQTQSRFPHSLTVSVSLSLSLSLSNTLLSHKRFSIGPLKRNETMTFLSIFIFIFLCGIC